ncbi:hypothetical protein VSH64_35490 [Amycolatopsis rhabdoformis]|uniref:Uncharacterized protein n=2 Tax=Amycolatopsis rhabdoformis TaxID=1448059 RepID=A0ABZ1IP34_9PSEU|nr:hypothetical protein [Amycolatopsis rhabdoformis]WSE35312.1 hypothetical protein VSH64_35490 [Amycolatopsis rhabdoformis]
MRGIVVACGEDPHSFAGLSDVSIVRVPALPGKAEIDPLLGKHSRLIVSGTDADLAAVLVRLLRTDRVSGVSVGFVPTESDSAVAALWGLPTDPVKGLEIALDGTAAEVPLVRDDTGGVLAGRATLRNLQGQAYADEHLAFDGAAAALEVSSDADGLVARVTRGKLVKRTTVFHGRAFQLGCLPTTTLVSDGVAHPREVTKRTWYRHTENLRLIRP